MASSRALGLMAGTASMRLLRPVDPGRDHVRGSDPESVSLLIYGDYLCPYCRRLSTVLRRLREALGEDMVYVYRHFPNEHAHPGARFAALAVEAAGRQGRFWDLHDALYALEPPLSQERIVQAARDLGLDMQGFERDLADPTLAARIDEDIADGRANGVTGTPTIFIGEARYDGSWDFYSLLETLRQPVAARVGRTARAFAALPASGGIVLLAAALLALICANTAAAPLYQAVVGLRFGIGPVSAPVWLTLADWCSEGLLTVFFLLVGLEIRRELTAGAFTDRRAAVLPIACAIGGVLAPAAIYLAINHGPTAAGWSAPTSTGIAFALGVLAVVGRRASTPLKVFVAALSVVDDILSVLVLAVFYPQNLHAVWLLAAAGAAGLMFAFNRWRVYAGWPYLAATAALWLALHAAGVNASLAGVVLAAFLPTRPAPSAGALLAQTATALAALEHAETVARNAGRAPDLAQEPVWDWASRNLSAASTRLLSPADRVERAVSPWAAYVVLPLFAFTATGVRLGLDLHAPTTLPVLAGVVLGLVIGKPLGVILAAVALVRPRLAIMPEDTSLRAFLGAAILCGVSDPVALLLVDQAFPHGGVADVAKIGVLIGSVIAAGLGVLVLLSSPPAVTPAAASVRT